MANTDEIEMLRLPCGHLKTRPSKLVAIVVCRCDRTWRLVRSNGEWCARLVEPEPEPAS